MPPKKPMLAKPSLDDLLASAALPEKTVEVYLAGRVVAEIEEAERELRDQRANAQTMADRGRTRQIAERIEALRAEMQSSALVVRLRGLNRKAWAALLAEHPPRRDQDVDKQLGYNVDTFFPALIRACIIDPVLDDAQWEQLDAVLSSSQYDALADAALAVSRRKVDVPFSFAASATLQNSDETSKPQSA